MHEKIGKKNQFYIESLRSYQDNKRLALYLWELSLYIYMYIFCIYMCKTITVYMHIDQFRWYHMPVVLSTWDSNASDPT